MRLLSAALTSFRNLRDVRLDFPAEGLALVGPNAQGKTNLLEALYYLETFRSFRGARDADLVRFGADFFRVAGEIEARPGERGFDGGLAHCQVAVGWQRQGAEKRVSVDGVAPARLADGIGHLGAVMFSPADLSIVNDGPEERRRFMDILLSLNHRGYLGALQRFRQVLSQRNAALKETGRVSAAEVWNGMLVEEGAKVTELRNRWIGRAEEPFARAHEAITGGVGVCLEHEPGIPGLGPGPWDVEAVKTAFREALLESRERERRRGTTVVGPHRDELRIRVGPPDRRRDVRRYGSGGERRSVSLALRLLEAETVRVEKGREPILLMDDVFAELDGERSERLLELLMGGGVGQIVLTAPKESDVRLPASRLPRWSIREGEIFP